MSERLGWRLFCAVACCLIARADLLDSPYKPGPGLYPRWEAKDAEPGLTYGTLPGVPLPKTLLYAVTADDLTADAEVYAQHGYGGFFLTGIAGEWSTDIWGVDGAPWTIGASDATFQKTKAAVDKCRALNADVFLTTAFSHTFEWFNDTAWQRIEHQFRQLAIFARDTGCTGLAIDIEYIWPQYHFTWPDYDYKGYTRRDLVEMIRKRFTAVARSMYDEFPDMVLLTLPESSMSLGSHIQSVWVEEAARRNAPGGVHMCTEFTYRRPNARFMLGHAWMNNDLAHRRLSEGAFKYWQQKCSISEGIWVFGDDPEDYHGSAPTVAEFKQAFAASLMAGSRYNWIYSHTFKPWFIERETEKYTGKEPLNAYVDIIRQREIITNDAYVKTAASLRAMELRDYAGELGVTIVPTFAGPREELEVNLMPAQVYAKSPQRAINDDLFALGFDIYNGRDVNPHAMFGTQAEWQLAGPFANADGKGFDTAYAPEQGIDPAASFDTPFGKVGWQRYAAPATRASIDLTQVMKPTEDVCAYALCYVHATKAQAAQVRLGANDSWKLWVDGELIAAYKESGRIILDREISPITLKEGVTPILLKVCNSKKDWGFIFRITDEHGKPIPDITITPTP